jgi:hypothetical protein
VLHSQHNIKKEFSQLTAEKELVKKCKGYLGVVIHTCNPRRQEDLKSKASLGYIKSSYL